MAYPETLSELTNYPKALSHAESGGGGATIKTVIFENNSGSVVLLSQVINTDGKYVLSENGPEDGVVVPDGETYTAKYVEPITGGKWSVSYAGNTTLTCPTGITDNSFELQISPEAEDGAVVVCGAKITPPMG